MQAVLRFVLATSLLLLMSTELMHMQNLVSGVASVVRLVVSLLRCSDGITPPINSYRTNCRG